MTLGQWRRLLSDQRPGDRVNAQNRAVERRRTSPSETLPQRRIPERLLRERVQTEWAAKLTDSACELLPPTLLEVRADPLTEGIAPNPIRALPDRRMLGQQG